MMKFAKTSLTILGGGLALASTAAAQDVRMPQGGEYFRGSWDGGADETQYGWARFDAADPAASTPGSSSGIVTINTQEQLAGLWTVDHETGAFSVSVAFLDTTTCDAWPDYTVGETIDLTSPSAKNCWLPERAIGVEMTYEGVQ